MWIIKRAMNHLHSAVSGHGEDLTVLWWNAEGGDGGAVTFQNTTWFPEMKSRTKQHVTFWDNLNNLDEFSLHSGSSPRKMWVPHAYESVHAASDQQTVLLTKVKGFDTFMDGENRLVAWSPELRCPGRLDLLCLAFIAGLSNLSQLLLGICQRQHTAWRRETYYVIAQIKDRAHIELRLLHWYGWSICNSGIKNYVYIEEITYNNGWRVFIWWGDNQLKAWEVFGLNIQGRVSSKRHSISLLQIHAVEQRGQMSPV